MNYKRIKIVLPDGSIKTGKIDTAFLHSEIERSILNSFNLQESDYTIRDFNSLDLDEPILVIDNVDFKN